MSECWGVIVCFSVSFERSVPATGAGPHIRHEHRGCPLNPEILAVNLFVVAVELWYLAFPCRHPSSSALRRLYFSNNCVELVD